MKTLNFVAIAIGLLAGCGVSAIIVPKWRARIRSQRLYSKVTYDNITEFAKTCMHNYPSITMTRVVVEKLDATKFRVTQLMLDNAKAAVRNKQGEPVGRIVLCKQLDAQVESLCDGEYPSDFDISL